MRLQAIGMFHRTAMRTRAFTSESCGCGLNGSQKKISMSRLLSERLELPVTCFQSGPLGGDQQVTGSSRRSLSSLPVVPVAKRMWSARMSRLYSAHSRRSPFLSSWATRAMRFGSGEVGLVMLPACRRNVAKLPHQRYGFVYIACLPTTRRDRG